MTTIQRWAIDPLLNWQGHDRTLRTVFTHDHLGPSTHQQVGLYAGVLVEPQGSQWYLPDGEPMNTRVDGGPTSWQAMIVTANPQDAHREYAIEFQDMQLAYTAESNVGPKGSNALSSPSSRRARRTEEAIPSMTATADAPAAFYIGQTSDAERSTVQGLIEFLQGPNDGDHVPQAFLDIFPSYGILLDQTKTPRSTTRRRGLRTRAFRGGNGCSSIQPALDANGPSSTAATITSSKAPIRSPTTTGTQLQALATSLSVYTPNDSARFRRSPTCGQSQSREPIRTLPRKPRHAADAGDCTPRPSANSNFGNGAPYPSLVSTRANGTYSMNYRNEPVQLRVKPGDRTIRPTSPSRFPPSTGAIPS